MDPITGPGWCKFYADGTNYYCTDIELQRKKKSWRNSKLDGMTMVMVRDKNFNCVRIRGTGDFWQSDMQIAELIVDRTVPGTTIKRRVMKRIHEQDAAILVQEGLKDLVAQFLPVLPVKSTPGPGSVLVPLTKEHVGQWFIVETDVQNGTKRHYFSAGRV